MISLYLVALLIIIISTLYLYSSIRNFIENNYTNLSCFKVPKFGYVPIFGHFFLFATQVSKRGYFIRFQELFSMILFFFHRPSSKF